MTRRSACHHGTVVFLLATFLALATAVARAQTAYAFSTLAGQPTPAGFVDGPGANARFNAPTGVAVDRAGNIYVADSGNYVIRKITPAGVVATFAGQAGAPARLDGPGTSARFNSLGQLALDADGNLLVTELWNGSVRRITLAGVVTTVAGGQSGSWQDGPVSWSGTGFSRPLGVAADATGNIYVADSDNATIRKILPAGVVTTIAGASGGADHIASTDGFASAARFNQPGGLGFDTAGNLFIADSRNHTIRKLTPDGIVSTYAGMARASGSDDGAREAARFSVPIAVVMDASGNLYVSDSGNHTIRRIGANGIVATVAGLANQPGGDDGTGAAARFNNPQGLALDAAGNLIVADTGNNAIRRVTPLGVVTTIAGRASLGSTDGAADSARFTDPQHLAVDPARNVYVSEPRSHIIRKITPTGVVTTLAGSAGFAGSANGTGASARFNSPGGLAVDGAGNVYVADSGNNMIRKITPQGVVTTLAGSGALGMADGPAALAQFNDPRDVAVDAAGNVYVADSFNHRIRKISPGGDVTTIAGSSTFGKTDGPVATAQFGFPTSIAVDRNGTLMVLDDGLRKIAPDGTVTTLTRYPYGNVTDGPLGAAQPRNLADLAFDRDGNLYFTTGEDVTVRELTAQGTVITVGGRTGNHGLTDGIGAAARFTAPNGIAVDDAGTLYIAEPGGPLIRRGTPTTAVAPPLITNIEEQNQKLVAGTAAKLEIVPAGTPPFAIQWSRDGTAIPGATSARLTFDRVSPADQGRYSVTIANSAGADQLSVGYLSVYAPALSSFVTRRSMPGGAFLWGIASGNGRLVTVGTNGTILTSTDGRSWTKASSGTTDWLVGVTYGAGQFVAVGDHGRILISNDGLAWASVVNTGTTQRLNNVAFGGGTFVAVGEGGAIVTSPDARTWTARSSGVTTWLRGLDYNAAERHFAVSGQRSVFLTSPDGVNWSAQPAINVAGDLEATVAVSSYATFVSIGESGVAVSAQRWYFSEWWDTTRRYYSWSWRQDTAGTDVRLRGIAQAANAIFATGENGVILSAPDITGPWARLDSGTTANLVAGVFFGNTLYVVGENETILQSAPLYSSRLVNISTRGQVTEAAPMISGFVVTGAAPKQVLLRAVGPALTRFGVADALSAPALTLYDGAQRPLAANVGWSANPDAPAIANAAIRVGGFPFQPNSGDSALLVTLAPGAYTAVVGANGGRGVALVEAYDADALSNEGSRAINISTRGLAGGGENTLIAGFVVGGTASRRVLIRAVGPSLAGFGVTGTLAQPQITVYGGSPPLTASAWSTRADAADIRSAGIIAGAFPLREGSTDAALVAVLSPRAYTVQVSSADSSTGTVLIEVYDLP